MGAAGRVGSIARGEPQTQELPVPDGVGDDGWAAAFESHRVQSVAAWSDDEVLGRKFDLPFGTFTGATVAQIYTLEMTTHGWDLAAATGQVATLDDELAVVSLLFAHGVLPPDFRRGEIPFAAVAAVPDDASAYDQLAGFLGRTIA